MKVKSVIVNLNECDKLFKSVIKCITSKKHSIEEGILDVPVFNDGETSPNFKTSVRGKRIYILTSANTPLKREQLMLTIDSAKRASACEIIPILPYMPYARQDKKDQYRGPIGAKVIAESLEQRGASSIITFDLHANQIVGFFNIPVIHLKGKYLFYDYILHNADENLVLCSPDAGGLKRVKKVRDLVYKRQPTVKLPFISLDKTRPKANEIGEIEVLGDVKDKDVIIIDDMVDTFGTADKSINALIDAGALTVKIMATHGVLSGPAFDRINNNHNLTELIISDSITHNKSNNKIKVISTSNMIVDAILSINDDSSINHL
jgi:ribose-phosphate pyrophosphokinase